MRKIVAATLALAMMPFAAHAQSANPLVQERVVLNLADLDLATVDGQQSLSIRLDQAARAVCGENMERIHLALAEQSRACQAEVVANARARIDERLAHAKIKSVRLASN